MARGKIKSINSGDTGSIIDNETGKEVPFIQPGVSDMELRENYVVSYDLITIDSGASTATNFVPVRKATVKSIKLGEGSTYTGEISDTVTGAAYTFKSVFAKESLPKEGDKVRFDLIKMTDCKPLAINLNLRD